MEVITRKFGKPKKSTALKKQCTTKNLSVVKPVIHLKFRIQDEDIEEMKKVKSKMEEWFSAEGDNDWEMLSDAQIVQFDLNDQQNLNDFEFFEI